MIVRILITLASVVVAIFAPYYTGRLVEAIKFAYIGKDPANIEYWMIGLIMLGLLAAVVAFLILVVGNALLQLIEWIRNG